MNPAQCHINGGTITHQLKQTILEARAQQNHKKFLCKKHQWDEQAFNDIAWEAHRRALNQLQHKKTILIKYVNGIAPVGKMVNRYDKKYAINCQSCEAAIETQDHLITCINPKREAWRQNLLNNIKTVMDTYKAPQEMKILIVRGIKQAMMEPTTEGPNNIPPELTSVAIAQGKIGWNQLLKGRISKEWIAYLERSIGSNATDSTNAITWATVLI
jgi:hypothetical protein